jgi:hypothetical protein
MEPSILAVLIAVFLILLFVVLVSCLWRNYFIALMLGLSIRLVAIFIQEQTRILTDADINDFLPYYLGFEKAIQSGNIIGFIEPHAAFYAALYPGWIFSVVGESGLWVERLINSILGVSVVIPLAWIHQIVFNRKMSQVQACLIVLWPSWIVHTVFVGRTALTVISVLTSLGLLLELSSAKKLTKKPLLWIGLMVSAFLVCMLRVHEVAYFIPILSLGLFGWIDRLKNATYIRPILYMGAFLAALPISLGIVGFYQNMVGGRYNLEGDSLENAVSIAKGGEFGGAVYLEGIYPNTPLDWIWYLPLQGFHFLFSPLPWSIHTPFAAASSFQALIVLGLCLYGFYRAKKVIWGNSPFRLLILTVLFASLAFGSGVKNAAAAERWRMPLTLILLTISTRLAASPKSPNKYLSHSGLAFSRKS